jgi:hypothetical protein
MFGREPGLASLAFRKEKGNRRIGMQEISPNRSKVRRGEGEAR